VSWLSGRLRNAERHQYHARITADRANEAKSRFLANLSHEVRTPLAAVVGFADLLENPQLANEERHEFLSAIRRNGQFLVSLIRDVEDLTSLESGTIALDRSPVRLEVMIQEIEHLLEDRARQGNIGISFTQHGSWTQAAYTDATRVKQIALNCFETLISLVVPTNAEKNQILEGKPCFHFRARAIKSMSSRAIEFDFQISASTENRDFHLNTETFFEPFADKSPSQPRRARESGLGLALARKVARVMGGDVEFKHSPASPSEAQMICITVTLPMEEAIEADLPAVTAKPLDAESHLTGRKVLIVDDNEDNHRLLDKLLVGVGAKTSYASSGQDALDQVSRELFDVIIMDIQMPEMDGYETTRRLRAKGLGSPIIALTANAMNGDRQRCIDAGCSDYLTKPIDKPLFLATLDKHLTERPGRLN
jgi:CheY-like chemotaxis protein